MSDCKKCVWIYKHKGCVFILTRLIIVRHCQAQGNLERFFQGKIDSDITPLGRKQIEATAEFLKNEKTDIIYTSTKKRAQLSAHGINKYHNAPVVIDERLCEIDAGKWEGVHLTDIEKLYPEQFYNWENSPSKFHAPDGESMTEVYDRVSSALDDIIRNNNGKTVCIVSHGCAIKNMICYLHGKSAEHIGEFPLGTNMSVNIVETDENIHTKFLLENYSKHLE